MNKRVNIKKVYGLFFWMSVFHLVIAIFTNEQGFLLLGVTLGETEDFVRNLNSAIFVWLMWVEIWRIQRPLTSPMPEGSDTNRLTHRS